MRITIDHGISDSLDEAARLAPESHRFLNRAWFLSAVNAYGLRSPRTVTVRRPDGQLVFALPIVTLGGWFSGLTQVPGCYWPFRSLPIPVESSIKDLVKVLADESVMRLLGSAWRIGPVYEDDSGFEHLAAAARSAGWVLVTRRLGVDYVLNIAEATRDSVWPRSSTLKKNRYFEKQLSERGTPEWLFLRGGEINGPIIGDLEVIERRSWVGNTTDHSGAKFLSPRHRTFWATVFFEPSLADNISVSLLRVGGRPVAFSLDVDCPPIRYVIANSFDVEFAAFSPGRLLTYRSLVRSMSAGIELVDWGAGDSGYKSTVGAQESSVIVDAVFIREQPVPVLAAKIAAWMLRRRGATVSITWS